MFKPGQSGNPNGRPKGCKNKRPTLRAILLEPHAEAIMNKLIQLALEGDTNALKICVERLIPIRKVAPVEFEVEDVNLNNPSELLDLATDVLKGVINNEIEMEQATELFNLLESYRNHTLTHEMSQKLEELEKRLK